MPVKLRVLGVQTRESVDYKAKMTVGDVLTTVKVEYPQDATVTVNGEVATRETPVPDNALVVVTPRVSNG